MKKLKGLPSFIFSSNTVKKRWLISVFYISLIPILIGCCLYLQNNIQFKDQTVYNNEVLLYQVQNLIDSGFYDVKSILYHFADHPNLDAFASTDSYSSKNSLKKYELVQELNRYVNSSSYINDIYICFWDTNQIVSSKTIASPNIMYLAYYDQTGLSYQEWLELLQNKGTDNAYRFPQAGSKGSTNTLAYMRDLSEFGSRPLSATIIGIIDYGFINNLSQKISESSGCRFNILFDNGSLTIYDDSQLAENLKSGLLHPPLTDDLSRTDIQGGSVVSYVRSEAYDITYFLTTPSTLFVKQLHNINFYFFAALLMILLASLFAAFIFIHQNYKPIKEIIGVLSSYNADCEQNEYSVIKDAIIETQNRNSEYAQRLDTQNEHLTSMALMMLLQGSLYQLSGKFTSKQLDGLFPNNHFLVMLFCASIDQKAERFSDAQLEFISSQIERFSAGSDFSEWHKMDKRAVRVKEYIVWILNPPNCTETWNGSLERVVGAIVSDWKRLFLENLEITHSSLYSGLDKVPDAFQEAELALKYRLIFGIDRSGFYQNKLSLYYYPPEDDLKLYNSIVSGHQEEALLQVNNIWFTNVQKNGIDGSYLSCLIHDIAGTVIRAFSMSTITAPVYTEFSKNIDRLMMLHSAAEQFAVLQDITRQVCEQCRLEHESANKKLKKSIIKYIEDNYQDAALSVEKIGDVFSKSRTALFSLFKEETGYGISYHINHIRVEHAKELLEDNRFSVQEIAAQVGFNSVSSFSRMFKSIENIPPGKYRELHHKY